MTLRLRLQSKTHELTAADHRLLRVILADPAAAADLSISAIAERASVHEASAVRLAKRLGYSGYPDLRADLKSELEALRAPSSRIQHVLERSAEGELLEELVQSERRALARIVDHVRHADLIIAADLMIASRRICIFAQGHAESLGKLAARRLSRSGYQVLDLCRRGRDLAEAAGGIARDDLLLVFTLRRLPADASHLLAIAHGLEVPVVLVSDQLGWALSPRPRVVLSAPRGEESDYQTLTVPMTIVNALLLMMAARDDGRSIAGLARTARLSKLFDAAEERGRA